jgi:hypothetical protein
MPSVDSGYAVDHDTPSKSRLALMEKCMLALVKGVCVAALMMTGAVYMLVDSIMVVQQTYTGC